MGLTKNINHIQKHRGFTIIEVLIVLAIAGLIILLVILTVPSLKRSLRNKQRNSDASLLGSAVNECVSNTGNPFSCTTTASLGLDPSKFQIFTNIAYTDPDAPVGYTVLHTDGAVWLFGTVCQNNRVIPYSIASSYTVTFLIEEGGSIAAKCISG